MNGPHGMVPPEAAGPLRWIRLGQIVDFGEHVGSVITGDPVVVRDEEAGGWRMFAFCLPPGHGQAVCRGDPARPGDWEPLGSLEFTNVDVVADGIVLKPFPILDPNEPNRAARVGGRFGLVVVAGVSRRALYRAWSRSLRGPWTLEPAPVLTAGSEAEVDAAHVEAPSAYLWPDGSVRYFYMATPVRPQPRAHSPLGSAQATAIQRPGERGARKLGVVIVPVTTAGHWAAGWIGGLQLVRRHGTGWLALLNAGPHPPREDDERISRDEPPPSLGGFAWTADPEALEGWEVAARPIERVEDIPADAAAAGEHTNLWRHHLLALPDGRRLLFYNAGPYAEERLFGKLLLAESVAGETTTPAS